MMPAAERAKYITPNVLRQIEEANKKRPNVLTLVSDEERLQANRHNPKHLCPDRVWLSRKFMVQEYVRPDRPTRLTISRTSMRRDGHFVDGITWDELMQCKSEIGYASMWAVEIYPDEAHIVCDANFRHLWIVPKPDFAWSKGD